jgi:putative oxidoreductase
MLSPILATDSDWVPTLARIILGIIFFAHGGEKMFGWFGGPGLKQTVQSMTGHTGLPAGLAFCAVAVQFFGGGALVLGLLGRIAALGIAVVMVSAIVMVHGRYGLFLNWFGERKGHGYEYHLLAIASAMVVIIKGSGALSLDRLLYAWTGA